MKYRWFSRRAKGRVHLCSDDGFTLCKAENGNARLDRLTDEPPPDRSLCGICTHLRDRAEAKGSRKKRKRQKSEIARRAQRDLFLQTWEWRQVRYEAIKRSKGKCEACGRGPAENAILNVDHIKPRKHFPELALTPSNLQVLCMDCNHGKGNRDETDWREPRLRVVLGERVADDDRPPWE